MKSMTCFQLGGAFQQVFTGGSFEELARQSQQHGREMCDAKDAPHLAAMARIMDLAKSGEMETWMAARKAEFDAL